MKNRYKLAFVLLFSLLSFGAFAQTTCAPVTYTSCPGFKTYTQGGWGSTVNGNNPGTYITNNFAAAFPNGLTVGCTRKIQFTSAAAVRAFLPQGGTSGLLPTGTTVNPTNVTMTNVLAGQVVALALNMGFDAYDLNFGSSSYNLKDLRIATGPFMGMTVQEFYNEACKKLGNCTAAPFTFSQYNTAATAINENYDNGVTKGNYLSCPLLISDRIGNLTCNNDGTGSISITITNAVGSYSILWSNGATTSTITGLQAGTYTVTITDALGSVTKSYTVTQPDPYVLTTNGVNVKCYDGTDGNASVGVTGNTPPYSYVWSNGQTTAAIYNLTAGTYTVTVTDSKGCQSNSSTVTITQPDLMIVTNSQTNVSCNGGNNGTASLNIVGGTTPYTILWSTGENTSSISNLIAGQYEFNVTDANGCDGSGSNDMITITQPTALAVSSNSINNVSCNGGSNGSITLSIGGGVSPYTYTWSNGASTSSLSNLSAGTYDVLVTDNNNCTLQASYTVSEPTVLNLAVSSTNVLCFGGNTGTASGVATGGTAPYAYLWSNGSTASSLSALRIGTFTLTVTDANGCTAMGSTVVSQPTALAGTTTSTRVSCYGGNDGTATVNVSGGTTPYSYQWSNGSTTATTTGGAGNYTVTVTDANGCTIKRTRCITQPTAISLSITKTNVSCNGGANGTATANPIGGTAPFSYSWSNGATTKVISGLAAGTYTVTVTDSKGCVKTCSTTISQPSALFATLTATAVSCYGGNDGAISTTNGGGTSPYSYSWSNGASSANINNLIAGNYTLVITDANGCTISRSKRVCQPTAPLSATSSQSNVTCNGGNNGSASVTAAGGTAPYSYSWSNGAITASASNLSAGTYTVTITDAKGCQTSKTITITEPTAVVASTSVTNVLCNGGNGTVVVSATGGVAPYSGTGSFTVAAGTYNYTVTDANGCSSSSSATVTEPSALSATASATDALCNGLNGSIEVTANGGTAPYSGTGSYSVAAGTYNYTVTDANGCSASTSAAVAEPSALSASSSATDALCNGSNGSIEVTANGGTAPYSGIGSFSVAAGSYNYTVTDANGCSTSTSATVAEPSSLVASTISADAICFGDNGSVTVSANGGTAPYTGTGVFVVPAGSYEYVVTDANGCVTSTSATVTEPTLLIVEISTTSDLNNTCSGTASVTYSGGVAPYTVMWSNGFSTNTISNLCANSYTVTVTCSNGCSATRTGIVNPEVTTCDPLKTYTQGGWGATPNGNNPGVYLHNNFSAAFPNGLTIGCTNTLTLTSASAVTGWLPSGTTASLLPAGNMVDNITYNNVLASQLATATLNVGFDAYDASFASSGDLLGSRYLTISGFEGMTVNQVIAEANQAIGGCGIGAHTLAQLNMALTTINENYDNGNTDEGHLTCTPPTSGCRVNTKANQVNSTVSSMYPVPCNNQLNVVINGEEAAEYSVSISDLSGRVLSQELVTMSNAIQSIVLNTSEISSQMIIVSITGINFVESHKVLVQH